MDPDPNLPGISAADPTHAQVPDELRGVVPDPVSVMPPAVPAQRLEDHDTVEQGMMVPGSTLLRHPSVSAVGADYMPPALLDTPAPSSLAPSSSLPASVVVSVAPSIASSSARASPAPLDPSLPHTPTPIPYTPSATPAPAPAPLPASPTTPATPPPPPPPSSSSRAAAAAAAGPPSGKRKRNCAQDTERHIHGCETCGRKFMEEQGDGT
ncbi:hypothetical protein AMAG_18488 [Allomyces macrogynus ATCC 38327]|uniref:Uncharacterized protein n=1 Tax=Allomyces macrogynus (strain ATCC 38327) TaxID=578462 RepID=A0A0L0SCK5_ALLM3|nr:hypothetical protein AMAG_18488 [Allomyces macrogynus ATCC 38327]|eukprot:KNE60216.1 hypothetical protein AMAG_18488 [Allomyces macrogynus ATCC 38327]